MSFLWESPVYFDELDPTGTLHHSRFPVHVERAQSALFEHLGIGGDLNYVVKELHIEFHTAFTSPGVLPVEITAERVGATSARYGFRCGHYADGYRVIVKVDARGRPAPWSDWCRVALEGLR